MTSDSLNDAPELPQIERFLTELWRDTLQADSIGSADDFFAAGGDSLSQKRMLLQVQQQFGVTVSLKDFSGASSIAALAKLVAEKISERSGQSGTEVEEGLI